MKRRTYGPSSGISKKRKASNKIIKSSRTRFVRPAVSSSVAAPSSSTSGVSRFNTRLIYLENAISVNPGLGGTAASYTFNLNGLFDPNVTGVGHQPTGFDQLMAIYEQYLVTGVRYRIGFHNTDNLIGAIVGVTISDDPTTTVDPRRYCENGQTQWKTLAANTSAGPCMTEIAGYVSLPAVHGYTYQEYLAYSAFRGISTANPPSSAFMQVWAAPINGASDMNAVDLFVELEFYCLLQGGKLNILS